MPFFASTLLLFSPERCLPVLASPDRLLQFGEKVVDGRQRLIVIPNAQRKVLIVLHEHRWKTVFKEKCIREQYFAPQDHLLLQTAIFFVD